MPRNVVNVGNVRSVPSTAGEVFCLRCVGACAAVAPDPEGAPMSSKFKDRRPHGLGSIQKLQGVGLYARIGLNRELSIVFHMLITVTYL